MADHPMQRIAPPGITVTGPVPERDPAYGVVYNIIEAVAFNYEELKDEVWFDGIRTDADGYVHLTLRPTRRRRGSGPVGDLCRVAMSSHHADAHLVVMDPIS